MPSPPPTIGRALRADIDSLADEIRRHLETADRRRPENSWYED
jgi:hypothetical protein